MEQQAPEVQAGLFGRLFQSLIDNYGPAGPFFAIAAIGVVLMVIALPILLRKNKDPLERFSFSDEKLKSELVKLREGSDDGSLSGLADYLEPKTQEEMSEVRNMLRSAGYRSGSAVRQYFFARAALALGLGIVAFMMTFMIPKAPNLLFSGFLTLTCVFMGFFMPAYWVRRKIDKRRQEITNAFPDAMDMMLVCIEGGQSLDQAMTRVGEEMEFASGPLAEEFQLVSYEFRAGKDRISVLRDFATRCAVSDISSFVTVLIQATSFGTSVAQALRVYAAEMRDKRLMRAEEKANTLPTKLTLGTMAFTVPPLILILVGPSIIMILRALGGLSSGQMPQP